MRNIIKTLIIFLTTTIILSSCESTIYFDSPQPRKYKNQNSTLPAGAYPNTPVYEPALHIA